MRVTVVTVTENRHAFMPWLYEQFRKQTHDDKELVVVDSSRHQVTLPKDPRVTLVRAIPGTTIGAKLNVGIEAARGQVITRFDDDDWQHPENLAWKAAGLGKAPYGVVGWRDGWFLDLETYRIHAYRGLADWLAPITTAFARDFAQAFPFPNTSLNEDTAWMATVLVRCKPIALPPERVHSLWIRHDRNTTPRLRRSRTAPVDLGTFVDLHIGMDTWADTGQHLLELTERLSNLRSRT